MKVYCATFINMKTHKLYCEYWLAWVRILHKEGHKYAQGGGDMCRGWNERFFILELCQPKRLKHRVLEALLMILRLASSSAVAGRSDPNPFSLYQCRFTVSTVSVYEVAQWMAFEMSFGLTINHFSFLPKWKILAQFRSQKSCMSSWSCLHKWDRSRAGKGTLELGLRAAFSCSVAGNMNAVTPPAFCPAPSCRNTAKSSLHEHGRKRCTTRHIDENSKIICF